MALGARTAKADEPDIDEINTQALQIIAESGQVVKDVSLGASHSAALTSDGSLWTWGDNSDGQLGDGTTTNRYNPQKISGVPKFESISVGASHSAALTPDGDVWTWGANAFGQLGDGTTANKQSPTKLNNIPTRLEV